MASSLELFFDLVFVVAVSSAASSLHHALVEGHTTHGVQSYVLVFFGVWWAWMNFTWFATSFDTDDWLYRVVTILQMAGVLTLAAGTSPAFEHEDFRIVVAGYIIMRVAMVLQWLRAARAPGRSRRAALFYAGGIAVVQVLWVVWLFLPHGILVPLFVLFALMELAVPVIAENVGGTPWHPHHITERYGLFTLILLGESLLASSNAVIEALSSDVELLPLLGIAVLTLVVTASLWWIYFWAPHHRSISTFGRSLRYGYAHYAIFAAAGAFSAGVEVQIDSIAHGAHLNHLLVSYTMSLPVAVFLLGVWWVAMRDHAPRAVNIAVPAGALCILAEPLVSFPMVVTAAALVAIVVVLVACPPTPERGVTPSS